MIHVFFTKVFGVFSAVHRVLIVFLQSIAFFRNVDEERCP